MKILGLPLSRPLDAASLMLAVALMVQSNNVLADREPQEWLNRMGAAVQSTSYEGTVIRIQDGMVEALKVVHTIEDGVNGFTFFDFAAHYLFDAVQRAIDVYRKHPERWKQMMITAMGQDFSWEKSAEKYLAVYTKTLGEKGGGV